MRTFSGYGFKHLQKLEDIPKTPHYVGVAFGTRSEYSPPYDAKDTASTYSVPDVKHYILKDRAELERWVEEISNTETSYTFYHVSSLGRVQRTIHIDIDLADK